MAEWCVRFSGKKRILLGTTASFGDSHLCARVCVSWDIRFFRTGSNLAQVLEFISAALYPYVYLLSRSAFKSQGKRTLEASQSLGYSRWTTFFKVVIPLARPWIAGGMLLVFMETLADFGAVSIFNFDTFAC